MPHSPTISSTTTTVFCETANHYCAKTIAATLQGCDFRGKQVGAASKAAKANLGETLYRTSNCCSAAVVSKHYSKHYYLATDLAVVANYAGRSTTITAKHFRSVSGVNCRHFLSTNSVILKRRKVETN